ncbi:RsiV family protein [Acinetobacter pollinis]|uniref:DUF3298 domain-containing protein n=1 Tax=Acinetobacter pollinis TaxID=2605270 RepID=A0ABU6DPN7_9GAMM|nr:RsiV family protein [Acinetobacter pollinis]MEB5475809.1 DUF3298 domain-containing protein [Acinetobacter pollinis]
MYLQQKMRLAVLLSSCLCSLMFVGCENKQAPSNNNKGETNPPASVSEPVPDLASTPTKIHAETMSMSLPQKVSCEADECTEYKVDTIETNVDWINDYFVHRLQKDAPLAFQKTANLPASTLTPSQINQSTYRVGFLGQKGHLATFVLDTTTYAAGAAHGMYHHEYIIFDINTHKRIGISDLFSSDKQVAVYQAVFDANQSWLEAHGIQSGRLEPTDNFYYNDKGLVFVYPLYELAPYSEGMTELVLPYHATKGLINPEYLPK